MANPIYAEHVDAVVKVVRAVNACFKDPGGDWEERSAHLARGRAALCIHQGGSIEDALVAAVGETAGILSMRKLHDAP